VNSTDFVQRLRDRERLIGYWLVLDAPVATERLARVGYDYLVLDGQHGLIGYDGLVAGLTAIDAAGGPAAGVVRVEANHPTPIGRALDAGAQAVIVPLVDSAEQAVDAVRAARFPPRGVRSYGPSRASLRLGTVPADHDAGTAVIAMIETSGALENVGAICETPGLDGVYVGPSDLSLGLGGRYRGDPEIAAAFEEALETVAKAAVKAGIAAGIHCPDGATARQRLDQGYTFASISCDLDHLDAAAAAHLAATR
jgi:2-keto-3-deoxy-L-rhamnonate aldolase RhmA